MNKSYKARVIPAYSIVRIPDPDDRVGYLTHNTHSGKPYVVIPAHESSRGIEISDDTMLKVVRYPGEVARLWLLEHRDDIG